MPTKLSCAGCGEEFGTAAEKREHEKDCEMYQKKVAGTTKKK